MCQVSSDCTRTCSINRGESHGPVPDRERRRIDLPRARARPQGDRPRPGRLRIRAGAVPRPYLPHQGTEDRDPPVPQREGRLHRSEEPRERQDGDRLGREADRGGRHPHQEESRDRGQNIVATSDLGAPLDLNAVAITLGPGAVEYEPEQFPGLVYRINEPKVVLLMFGSGKVVCTGARKPADVETAVEKITAELKANGLLH